MASIPSMMAAMAPSLSRTSSATSISSSDDATPGNSTSTVSRRTRKRFTSAQLAMLENLFHQNSHPSREEREGVANAGGMEVKSVTIWFQNKRQTERKVALHSSTNPPRALVSTTSLVLTQVHSPAYSTTASRPSLDRVASRTELRVSSPRTPTRRRDLSANLWDNMPSSPIASPVSPAPMEYFRLAKGQRVRRTLEWACAAARLAEKDGTNAASLKNPYPRRPRVRESHQRHPRRPIRVDTDLTEEESDEIVSPNGSGIGGDVRWVAQCDGSVQATVPPASKQPQDVHDDDVMRAALALCGLGRRSK
ncbi:hypothetical protein AX17_000683 [Amanita inopinata Kibby_2008]|nr:hypothetical protein AX17_000683 [Amanita inopinata Kibby_2008]